MTYVLVFLFGCNTISLGVVVLWLCSASDRVRQANADQRSMRQELYLQRKRIETLEAFVDQELS